MNIWEILHIEPTTDKKAIKKAYAARTKVIHPEEKPEEFRQLHEAYQAALKYAEFALKRERDFIKIIKDEAGENGEDFINDKYEPPTADDFSEQESAERSKLLSFFEKNQEKQQQRIDTFVQHWQDIKNISVDPEAYTWWEEYLASEDFQNIRWNAQILRLLTEEIDKKFFYRANEVKMLFWKAYGFRENEGSRYQGEQHELWECLYPAFEYYKKVFLAKEFDRKSKMKFYIFLAVVLVCVLFACLRASINNHNQMENEQQLIVRYMAEQYPGNEFSVPERDKQQGASGVFYTLYSSSHPDLSINARVEYEYLDGELTGLVADEDYGLQLLEYYAAQYGLECGQLEYERIEYGEDGYYSQEKELCNVLYYPDIEELDIFCETVIRMFGVQEELKAIPSVGICAGDILYPEVLLQGGVTNFHFGDPQIYDLRNADEKELAARLEEAYISYMFQYEPWNVNLEQCREWGPVYQEACWQWQNYRGLWYDLTDLHTGDLLCTLYVSTYMCADYRHGVPFYEESVTVGNAYDFLLIQGVDVAVNEDGSGFTAKINGQTESFGSEPEVSVNKLGSLPKEMQDRMQNDFFILE